MLDYKLIEALARVVAEGGFERAARALFLTQSAVSQRVRQLEESCGQVLLSRTSPPQPTKAGRALIKHYQQVHLLEDGLASELTDAPGEAFSTLAVGVNADSLESWFIAAIAPVFARMNLLVDLRVDDQEQTHRYLREGEVVGCVSTEARAMQGCRVEPLGGMGYHLLATPEYRDRWFPTGLNPEDAALAPIVRFNRKDGLHQLFFSRHLGAVPESFPTHYVPAPAPFLDLIVRGHACGMVADWQEQELLSTGRLVELLPGAEVRTELYWHCWNLSARPLQEFTRQLIAGARELLSQSGKN
ncbi:MAG: transcriptional regulator ArgP [Desulfuromonas sp.]|nr:MAG: transcriptional regulator ArgP [Desulfuromonas sp.]